MKTRTILTKEDLNKNESVRRLRLSVPTSSKPSVPKQSNSQAKFSTITNKARILQSFTSASRRTISRHNGERSEDVVVQGPSKSAWGKLSVIQVEPETQGYDLSQQMGHMLEKEAVSQVERLRTEVAIRLQQINNRVEKALSQVGMSRWDEQVSAVKGIKADEKNMIEAHFYEQDRRDAIAVQLREQMLDSSERFRILEELYDWFVMTKDFVLYDVITENELHTQNESVNRCVVRIDDAMKNTLNVVAKIKRMTNRLLVSGGYVDRLGRRRQPPTIVAEHDLQKDFGNTLDQAVGVLRKCHEELSKTIKGPKLGVWITSAQNQAKSLTSAVVKKYVEFVKLSQVNIETVAKLATSTELVNKLKAKVAALQQEVQHSTNVNADQRGQMKKMDHLMTSAYERSEYYESRLVNMSKDVDKVAQKLQTNKGAVNDVKVLKEAMKNMLTTPEGEQLGIRNASIAPSLPPVDDGGRDRLTQTEYIANPQGLVMIDKEILTKLQQENEALREYKSRGKAGSERTERKDKEPAPKTKTLKPDDDSPARKSKPQKSDRSLKIDDSVKNKKSDTGRNKNDTALVKSLNEKLKSLEVDNEKLTSKDKVSQEEIENLKGQFAAIDRMLRSRDKNMEELQTEIINDFSSFISKRRKVLKNYHDGYNNTMAMLKMLSEGMSDLYHDNKRLSHYVKGRVTSQFEGSLKRWVDRARAGRNSIDAENELKSIVEDYEKVQQKEMVSSFEDLPKLHEIESIEQLTRYRSPSHDEEGSGYSSSSYRFVDRPSIPTVRDSNIDDRIRNFKPYDGRLERTRNESFYSSSRTSVDVGSQTYEGDYETLTQPPSPGSPRESVHQRSVPGPTAAGVGSAARSKQVSTDQGSLKATDKSDTTHPLQPSSHSKIKIKGQSIQDTDQYTYYQSTKAAARAKQIPSEYQKGVRTEKAGQDNLQYGAKKSQYEKEAVPSRTQLRRTSQPIREPSALIKMDDNVDSIASYAVVPHAKLQMNASIKISSLKTPQKDLLVRESEIIEAPVDTIEEDEAVTYEVPRPVQRQPTGQANETYEKLPAILQQLEGDESGYNVLDGSEGRGPPTYRHMTYEPDYATPSNHYAIPAHPYAPPGHHYANPTLYTEYQSDESHNYETISPKIILTPQLKRPFDQPLHTNMDDAGIMAPANAAMSPKENLAGASTEKSLERQSEKPTEKSADSRAVTRLPPLPPPQHPAAALRAAARGGPSPEKTHLDINPLKSMDTPSNMEVPPRAEDTVRYVKSAKRQHEYETLTVPRVPTPHSDMRSSSEVRGAPVSSSLADGLLKPVYKPDSQKHSEDSVSVCSGRSKTKALVGSELQIISERSGVKLPLTFSAHANLFDQLGDNFRPDMLPPISKHAAGIIADRWRTVRDKVIIFLDGVQSSVNKSMARNMRVVDILKEEKRSVEKSLCNNEQMLQAIQAEKVELEAKLKRLENSNKHLSQCMRTQKLKEDEKFSMAMEDIDGVRKDYQKCQAELRKMHVEFTATMNTKQELISDIKLRQQQFERVANLHKHLMARLESYMINNDMLKGQKDVSVNLPQGEHERRLNHLKSLCRSKPITDELKKMTSALTEQLGTMSSEKEKVEAFIKNYLDLPGVKNIEMMRSQPVWRDFDTEKNKKLLSTMSELSKQIEEQVKNIANKLHSVGYKSLEDNGNKLTEKLSVTGETSPRLDSECPAENASGRLTSYLTSTDIKMELLDETARIISTGATACTAERDRAADRLRLPSVAERRLRPPTVQGTSCVKTKPEIFWQREKSVISDHWRWQPPVSLTESFIDEINAKWAELDYRTGTKHDEVKGPKHQNRLKAVRGYCIDDKSTPLPMCTSPLKAKTPLRAKKNSHYKTAEFEYDASGIPRLIESRAKREKPDIMYRSVDFVD